MYKDYLLDALEMVLTWDLPEEDLADAVNDQARLMAGVNPDDNWRTHPDSSYQ